MHGLSIGNTLINNLNNHNYVSSSGGAQLVAHVDGRGRHSPKHKASEEAVKVLRKHILLFPREESHYSLTKKQTLNPELSVKAMHSLYEEQERSRGGRVLGYARYLQEFATTGLKFGKYAVDECATCTMLKEQIDADPDNDDFKMR